MLHIAASFGAEAEREFKKTIEIDRLIDNLRETEFQNVSATQENLGLDIAFGRFGRFESKKTVPIKQ